MPSIEVDDLQKVLTKYGQQHLLKYWSQLESDQRLDLVNDIKSIDFPNVLQAFASTTEDEENSRKLDALLQPIPDDLHEGVARCTLQQLQEYKEEGLRQISEGKVAALLFAGGQGTRLGVPYPKGMYDVGLPSRKTLYQLQGERLLRLEEMAHQFTGKRACIPWYIMTSEHTMEQTSNFFFEHDYFGLKKENIAVFEQFMLPCFSFDGKIILDTPWKVAKAPDGNGGLFKALQKRGILDDMIKRGIKYVHVYCVDNILVKMADPVFIGYCIRKNANCAAKVVEKVSSTEAVGVVCRVDGKFQVVEYSEISADTAQKRNEDGRLTFNAGNICNHFFTVDFLNQICRGDKKEKHHVAKKKIPYVGDDGKRVKPLKANGIKLEKFVFDVFIFSDKFAAWEVLREEEFSPLKNADGCEKDTPTTARQALYMLHRQYIEHAGGRVIDKQTAEYGIQSQNCSMNGVHSDENGVHSDENGVHSDENAINGKKEAGICEISPLVSYDGENLKEIVSGKTFVSPVLITSPEEITLASLKNGHQIE